jgi:hypothetical protein
VELRQQLGFTGTPIRLIWRGKPATVNDATIRRCLNFAIAWGYGSLWVGNLFAYRSRDPKQLYSVIDPIGPNNDEYLRQLAENVGAIILAYGDRGIYLDRGETVRRSLFSRHDLYCLGITRKQQPRHPLYLKKNTRPVLF